MLRTFYASSASVAAGASFTVMSNVDIPPETYGFVRAIMGGTSFAALDLNIVDDKSDLHFALAGGYAMFPYVYDDVRGIWVSPYVLSGVVNATLTNRSGAAASNIDVAILLEYVPKSQRDI